MKIVIVGMPGAGKTSLGKKLSEILNLEFIDTDFFIENNYKMSVTNIFTVAGEQGFRILEQKALKEILKSDNFVLSTGGGLPCFFNNMDIINESSISVYLKSEPERLVENILLSKKKRPMFIGLSNEEISKKIRQIFSDRKAFYEKSKITVDYFMSVYEISEIINKYKF